MKRSAIRDFDPAPSRRRPRIALRSIQAASIAEGPFAPRPLLEAVKASAARAG
jgi:hypothetical protein